MAKIYSDSKVEIQGFAARHYDTIMNVMTAGRYAAFIKNSIQWMQIQPEDTLLDLGTGTGRNAFLMAQFLSEKGEIHGLDVSPLMQKQFQDRCGTYANVHYVNQRIDVDFSLGQTFEKIWVSFVLHGFPHDVRQTILQNIYDHLTPGGSLYLLDFAEFSKEDMPLVYWWTFKSIECKYAFDFIEKDWKAILKEKGFHEFREKYFFKNYVRLLQAVKL